MGIGPAGDSFSHRWPHTAIGAFRILLFFVVRHALRRPRCRVSATVVGRRRVALKPAVVQFDGGCRTRISRIGDLMSAPSASPRAICFKLIPGARPAGGTLQL